MKKWLFLAVLMPTLCFATNGISVIGIGAKSKGMGGVGVALSQDAFAGAVNPASLAYQCSRIDLGFGWAWQKGCYTTSSSGGVVEFDREFGSDQGYWLPEAAASWQFCPCQTVAVAIYPTSAAYTKYATPLFNEQRHTEFFYYNLFVTPSWGWRLNTIHSVGAALNFSFSWAHLAGTFEPETIHPGDVSGNGTNSSEGVSFLIGWTGQFSTAVRLGATFQSTTWSGRYKKIQGFFVDEGHFNLPPQVGLGIGWFPSPCITFGADFIYRLWQRSDPFDNTALESGLPFANFGRTFGPGFGWKNQFIVKLGAAWTPYSCLTLRFGYNYGEIPVAPTGFAQTVVINALLLPLQEHHFTVGGTLCLCGVELTLFYYHAFRNQLVQRLIRETEVVEFAIDNQQNVAGVSLGRRF